MAAKTTTTENHNYPQIAGTVIGYAFLVGALVVSYTHIVHLFNMLGLHGWQAYVAPAFVDGFAMLGKLGRSRQFASDTRRTGLWIQSVATVVSLAANIAAGGSLGGSLFGVLAVAGYVVAEIFVDHLRPVQAEKTEKTKSARSQAAQKAAATRAANKAAKAKTTTRATAARKPRTGGLTKALTVPMIPEPSYI